MKSTIVAFALVASAVAGVAHAAVPANPVNVQSQQTVASQNNAGKTRAEVKADLVEWRKAGYDPLDWINYPANAIAAGRIVAQRRAQAQGTQQ